MTTDIRPKFKEGDLVEKDGGDAEFKGEIACVFRKKNGAIRYVVEDERGLLLIQSDKTLRAAQ